MRVWTYHREAENGEDYGHLDDRLSQGFMSGQRTAFRGEGALYRLHPAPPKIRCRQHRQMG